MCITLRPIRQHTIAIGIWAQLPILPAPCISHPGRRRRSAEKDGLLVYSHPFQKISTPEPAGLTYLGCWSVIPSPSPEQEPWRTIIPKMLLGLVTALVSRAL